MSRESLIITVGVWIIVLPLLGFPESWRIILFILTGLGLIALGLYMRAQVIGEGRGARTFVESRPRAQFSDIHAHEHQESLTETE